MFSSKIGLMMNASAPTFLQLFYQAIHEWVVADLPEDLVHNPYRFEAYTGLCRNLLTFGHSQSTEWIVLDKAFFEMKKQFNKANLSTEFPFSDLETYEYECTTRTIYQNQQRLDWIKDHL